MAADKPTELSIIKLKTWARQPVPMISEHSAHSTPLPFGIRTWLLRYTYLLLLISMLWHRQAIFESKGDKLSSSAECRIRIHQGLRHQIACRLNARWQTGWAIEDQAKKNVNSTARPYDQRAFSPLDPSAVWHSHLALAIYIFVVERRQVVFLCWMQDSNPSGSCMGTPKTHSPTHTHKNIHTHTHPRTPHIWIWIHLCTYIHTYLPLKKWETRYNHGFTLDCGNSIINVLELQQSCDNPLT